MADEDDARSDISRVAFVLHIPRDEDMRSEPDTLSPRSTIHSFPRSSRSARIGERDMSRSTIHSCLIASDADLDCKDPKEDVEGKVFRITRCGLQHAAWGADDESMSTRAGSLGSSQMM